MAYVMVAPKNIFYVGSCGWDREGKMICKSRYEISDPAAASSPSQEKEAGSESIRPGAQFSDCL
jgi:hypothetical protein